jgi:hypothetical protein
MSMQPVDDKTPVTDISGFDDGFFDMDPVPVKQAVVVNSEPTLTELIPDITKEELGDTTLVNPLSRCFCLSVEFHRFGITKKADMKGIQTDADKELLKLSKKLLQSPEYKEITSLDTEITNTLKTKCTPSLFRRGVFLVRKNYVKEIREILIEFKTRRKELVSKFLAAYPKQAEEAEAKLKSFGSKKDYPSVDVVADTFWIKWNFLEFKTPQSLKSVDENIYIEEMDKLQKDIKNAATEITKVVRAEALQKVNWLVDRLTDDSEGKKKSFKAPAYNKFKNYLEFFDLKDVTDDKSLKKLINNTKEVLQGIDAAELKDNDAVKDSVRNKLEVVKASLSTMMEETPKGRSRKVTFDDEEEECE